MKNQAINDHLKLITENGLLQAMKEIDENDFPRTRRIKYYKAIYNDTDKAYPPPLLIDKAYNYSVNQKLPEDFFNRIGKGSECFKFLEENGFSIIELENDSMKENILLKRIKDQDTKGELYIRKILIGEGKFFLDPRVADPNPDYETPHSIDISIHWDNIDDNFRDYKLKNFRREFHGNQDTRIAGSPNLEIGGVIVFKKNENESYNVHVVKSDDQDYDRIIALLDGKSYKVLHEMEQKFSKSHSLKNSTMKNQPLNQILYGPPGTGKTYSTITKALDILGIDYNKDNYAEAQEFFQDELGKRIEFVTMHQSFSYEDFVQGLKPKKGINGVEFDYKNGVFKEICRRADDVITEGFLDSKLDITREEKLLVGFFISKFNGRTKPDQKANEALGANGFSEVFKLTSDKLDIKINTIKAYRDHFDYKYDHRNGYAPNGKQISKSAGPENLDSPFLEIYEQNKLKSFDEIFAEVNAILNQTKRTSTEHSSNSNHVIILDEINRANISRVFGELIALIEDDKRDGKLSATLPSGYSFSVPSNLYIIGTMNTADKSIALVDIALRRRFKFVAMYPDTKVLRKVLEGKGIAHSEIERRVSVLTILNQIIRSKKTVDYEIGHSYFMSDDKLDDIMNDQVLPLLNEYFMYDLRAVKSLLENKQKDRDKNDIPMLGVKFDSKEYKNRGLLKIKTIDPSNVVVQVNDASDSEEEDEQ
jgi:5-methylcytosine-specific restriction enzyme B